ncbi:MAG TPA: LuxR C-terminal-related transcriptional regulator [Sphingomicrobium sp.]|jgi:DNA-binding CsgD family transcriptional regulator/catechol 2,3-dioxygenase-like lactoylglutathione lyase family enzyme|nr:LuxR C-terminal-related transcriptional regulator [Sphingomicrobium sp.]
MTSGPGRPRHDDLLTPAEWKVAEQVRHGMTNRRIAERMGVSLDAVKFHVGNALSKLGFKSRVELRRWDGVAKGTALDEFRRSAMNAQGSSDSYVMLGQVARTTKRFAESHAWYRDVLGLPELYSFGNLAFYDLAGVRLMLTEEEGDVASESILYLRVPDIHASKAELESRGVNFINAPHLIHRHEDGTEEWMAAFEDNEGRPLQLMMQVRAAAR